VKRKLVTNKSTLCKKSSLKRGHDLLCSNVAKENFGPVVALQALILILELSKTNITYQAWLVLNIIFTIHG
jgi:hypothetical protein